MFVKISEQPSLYNDLEKKSVREILEDINTEADTLLKRQMLCRLS